MKTSNNMRSNLVFAMALMLWGAAWSTAYAQDLTATANIGDTPVTATIYGRLDAGVDYETNVALKDANGNLTGKTGNKLSSAANQWGTNMIGFKGNAEVSDGITAFWLLESGFNASNGQETGNTLFNRRAYVGLSGAFGSIKFGKNLFIVNDVWYLDPTGQQYMGTASLVNGRNWPGANNVVEYQTPTWAGFGATIQTSLGQQAGSTKKGRADGISLVYDTGALELRGIYDVIRDVNGQYTNIYTNSKDWIVGGTYTMEQLKLFAGYEQISAPNTVDPTAPNKLTHYWVGANYVLSPKWTLIGAAFQNKLNNVGGSASLYVLGVNYNLSKHVTLYADFGEVANKGKANFATEYDNPLAGHDQQGSYTGIAIDF